MYDAMLAESVTITGHTGDQIEAYSARTLQAGPVGGVVVIHHLPGYDRQTKEFTCTFAAGGHAVMDAELYHREAPGAAPVARGGDGAGVGRDPRPGRADRRRSGRAAARARAEQLQRQGRRDRPRPGRPGGVPGRDQPAARRGRRLLRRLRGRDRARGASAARHPARSWTARATCPARCSACSAGTTWRCSSRRPSWPCALKAHGKTHEFHSYDGAGHAFMQGAAAATGPRPPGRTPGSTSGPSSACHRYGRLSVIGKELQCALT